MSVPESCVINTDLSVKVATPVPPLATGKIVAPTFEAKLTVLKKGEVVLIQLLKSMAVSTTVKRIFLSSPEVVSVTVNLELADFNPFCMTTLLLEIEEIRYFGVE